MPVFQPTILIPAYGRVDLTRRALASLKAAGAERVMLIDDDGHGARGQRSPRSSRTRRPGRRTRPCSGQAPSSGASSGPPIAVMPGSSSSIKTSPPPPTTSSAWRRACPKIPGPSWGARSSTHRIRAGSGREEGAWNGSAAGSGSCITARRCRELPATPYAVDWLFGMGTYVPMEIFERIGLPDGERFPMSWGDADFSLRARHAGIPLPRGIRARA